MHLTRNCVIITRVKVRSPVAEGVGSGRSSQRRCKGPYLLSFLGLSTCLSAWIVLSAKESQLGIDSGRPAWQVKRADTQPMLRKESSVATEPLKLVTKRQNPTYAPLSDAAARDERAFIRLVDRFNVPCAVVNAVLELKQGTICENEEILGNVNLPASEKGAWLQVLRHQIRETLIGVLGPECFDAYRKDCGNWIDQIGRLHKERKSGRQEREETRNRGSEPPSNLEFRR
jgi:hypothetical protein